MKLLLLLAFVASAYSAYFEPGESRSKRHSDRRDQVSTNPFGLVWGDPHFETFDRLYYDYQGHCTYILLRDNCKDGYPNGLPTFTVYGDFYNPNPPGVYTLLKHVYFEVAGKLIMLNLNGGIYVDGVQVTSYDSSGIIINDGGNMNQNVYWGGMILHRHHHGYGGSDLWIHLTDAFKSKVCGLLGNFNGNRSDDMVIGPHCPCVLNHKPGTLTTDTILFGESWKSDKFGDAESHCDMDACATTPPGGIPHPCGTPAMWQNARALCSTIGDPNGANILCLPAIDPTTVTNIVDACIFDVCATGDPSIVDRHNVVIQSYCPPATGKKTCTLEKGGLLNSFDGLNLEITREQKTLLASYDPSSTHTCRFQVRAVTTFDCAWDVPPQQLPLFVDWIAPSFDKRIRSSFGRRNILMTQQSDRVRIRGQNINQIVTSFPHSVALSDGSAVTIERVTVGGQVEFRVRSSAACQWGVNWRPDTRNSEADIFFEGNYGGQMKGMCGDADGNMANDWKTCSGGSVTPGPAGTNQITLSCREGKNQGQGIEGCTKTK